MNLENAGPIHSKMDFGPRRYTRRGRDLAIVDEGPKLAPHEQKARREFEERIHTKAYLRRVSQDELLLPVHTGELYLAVGTRHGLLLDQDIGPVWVNSAGGLRAARSTWSR